jgi:predicted permease
VESTLEPVLGAVLPGRQSAFLFRWTALQRSLHKLVLYPILMALLVYYVLPVDPFWAKIAVVCAALPLGATAFVLAQRYNLLEAETSTGAVVSFASLFTVSLVMALLSGR